MSGLFERLMGAGKKKVEANKADVEAQVRKQLKGIVYDDELVDELLPVFISLQGVQGFDKVLELLDTKERQIEAISGGEWFKQDSETETQNVEAARQEDEQETSQSDLVAEIIRKQLQGN